MTANTRSEQARINGSKSKGPSSSVGKSVSRKNAITHGLTSTILALPAESPELIENHVAKWAEAVVPATLQEAELTKQVAESSIRIGRINLAESTMLAEQVANVEKVFDDSEQSKLNDLTEQFWTDAKRAVLGLESLSAGAAWMIERWEEIKQTVEKRGTMSGFRQLEESLRLKGFNPNTLYREKAYACEWALMVASCFPDRATNPELNTYLDNQLQPARAGKSRFDGFDPALIVPKVLAEIDREIAALIVLRDYLQERENDHIERAKLIAQAPDDTPKNRLMLRYRKEAQSDFNRSFKLLEKLQSDRKKEAEKAAKEGRSGISRDEPNSAQVAAQSNTCDSPSEADLAAQEKHVKEVLMQFKGTIPARVAAEVEAIGFGYLLPSKMAA